MDEEETREKILETTRILFREKGYHETTMNDIVQKSETSKGTIYYYFDNKQELFETMINEIASRHFNEIEEVIEDDALTVKEKIRHMLSITIKNLMKNSEILSLNFAELKQSDKKFEKKIWQWHQKAFKNVNQVIQKGIETGFLKDKNSRLMTHSFMGLASSFVPAIIESDYDLKHNELVDFSCELYLEGVKAENDSQ